jgi:hypothetical protein
MQVAATTPQAAGRLFAIGPDVAKFLAVVALFEGDLGFVGLYLDCDLAEAGQLEYFLGFNGPGKCYKEQGEGNWCSFRGPT